MLQGPYLKRRALQIPVVKIMRLALQVTQCCQLRVRVNRAGPFDLPGSLLLLVWQVILQCRMWFFRWACDCFHPQGSMSVNYTGLSLLALGIKVLCLIYCFSLPVQQLVEEYLLWLIFMVAGGFSSVQHVGRWLQKWGASFVQSVVMGALYTGFLSLWEPMEAFMLDAFVVSVFVALVYAIHSMVYDALSYFAHVNKVIVKVPLIDIKKHITLYFLLLYVCWTYRLA